MSKALWVSRRYFPPSLIRTVRTVGHRQQVVPQKSPSLNPHVYSFPSRGKKIPTGVKYRLSPLISTLRHSIKKKKKIRFWFCVCVCLLVTCVDDKVAAGGDENFTWISEDAFDRGCFQMQTLEIQSFFKKGRREGGEPGRLLNTEGCIKKKKEKIHNCKQQPQFLGTEWLLEFVSFRN